MNKFEELDNAVRSWSYLIIEKQRDIDEILQQRSLWGNDSSMAAKFQFTLIDLELAQELLASYRGSKEIAIRRLDDFIEEHKVTILRGEYFKTESMTEPRRSFRFDENTGKCYYLKGIDDI